MTEMNLYIFENLKGKPLESLEYNDPVLINYAKKNYQDLISDDTNSELSWCYRMCNLDYKSRGGRLQKFPFFVYWLTRIIKDWNSDKIDIILGKLYSEDPNSIFHFPDFVDIQKIKQRYEKNKIVQRYLLYAKIFRCSNRKIYESILKETQTYNDFIEAIRNIKISFKASQKKWKIQKRIFDYMKEEREASKREISKKFSRTGRFSDMDLPLKDLIDLHIIEWNEKDKKFFFITEHPKSIESQDVSTRIIPVPRKS